MKILNSFYISPKIGFSYAFFSVVKYTVYIGLSLLHILCNVCVYVLNCRCVYYRVWCTICTMHYILACTNSYFNMNVRWKPELYYCECAKLSSKLLHYYILSCANYVNFNGLRRLLSTTVNGSALLLTTHSAWLLSHTTKITNKYQTINALTHTHK